MENGATRAAPSDELEVATLMHNAQRASELLKALAHEARLVILCLLAEGEKSVSELEHVLSLRQPAVSQQLARLRADDLVQARRDGKSIYYSLARPEVVEIVGALHRVFCSAGPTGSVRPARHPAPRARPSVARRRELRS